MDTASAKFTALKNRMVEGFYEMQQSSRGWIDYLIAGINKVLDLISKLHSGFNYLTMSKTQDALGDTEEFVKGKSKVLLKGKNLASSLTPGKDSYTSDMIKLNNAIAKLQTGQTDSVVYSDFDEQFQAFAILVIVLLIIEACILDRKNPALLKLKLFKKK